MQIFDKKSECGGQKHPVPNLDIGRKAVVAINNMILAPLTKGTDSTHSFLLSEKARAASSTWVRCISAQSLKTDLFAGFTSAVIVLPQSVAFAMIAGLPLEYGFYTAMITPVVAALFGSSHHMISGPTTAISICVFIHQPVRGTPALRILFA